MHCSAEAEQLSLYKHTCAHLFTCRGRVFRMQHSFQVCTLRANPAVATLKAFCTCWWGFLGPVYFYCKHSGCTAAWAMDCHKVTYKCIFGVVVWHIFLGSVFKCIFGTVLEQILGLFVFFFPLFHKISLLRWCNWQHLESRGLVMETERTASSAGRLESIAWSPYPWAVRAAVLYL